MVVGDAKAMNILGSCYAERKFGLPQNIDEAKELWLRSVGLGCTQAYYYNVASAYYLGNLVDTDKKNAKHYWELAAMGG